jgi:folate-binding protein YgfZ
MKTVLLEEHRAAGAQLSASDPPLLLTYGDVPAEYRAGVEGCALFDQTSRERVAVTGPDALVFLHRILANTVRTLEPGQGNRNLLLSPKGKVLFDFDLEVVDGGAELSLPAGRAEPLMEALDVFLFSEKARLEDHSATHAPLELCGPLARGLVLELLGTPAPEADHLTAVGHLGPSPVRITALTVAGSAGVRLDGGPELAPRLWRELRERGAVAAGWVARDSLRVEAGQAEPGVDIDESVYPQEARLERAFSLDKGCYVGQEVVAKIDTYGGLNKRLVALKLSHDDPVERGTRLWSWGGEAEAGPANEPRDLGVLTSWAYSFVLDTGLALGYVKRRHQAPGTRFRVGEGPAHATIVPLPVRAGAVPPTGEFE